jgi:photosystem II stability/assembly factor-like uncharacterized protein
VNTRSRVLARVAAGALAAGALAVALDPPALAQRFRQAPAQDLRYRFIGPDGNRAIAVAGEPGNPMVMYVGAASGGIFKTDNGGISWQSIFDKYEVSSVGALAIAPTAPNIVWAGTGETFLIRPAHAMGNGIYRSDDAGKTWMRMGLEKTGRIGRIAIHPANPEIVFACALGHAFGPQPERGVFRTRDGGRTWEQVLKVDENTGCSDIAIDVNNPRVVIAGMWQVEIKPWGLNGGGTGGGVYISRDGGTTWRKQTGGGLPAATAIVGKTAVAIAPSTSQRVYALIEEQTPTLYRSDDAGETWRIVNRNHLIAERAPYYTRFAVSPDNPNRLYFASVSWSVSDDGGETLLRTAASAGGDNHDIWIDPTNADRIMVAHDGGASVSLNRGLSYQRVVLPIAQMYHAYVDNQIPYNVYGNRQDGGSYKGPGISLQGGITLAQWRSIGGCESGFGVPDPVDNNIVWSGCYDGQLDRVDFRTGQVRSVHVWPEATYGWKPADVKYRWHWTFPIAISPHDHNTVYVGSQFVHRTTTAGQSWDVISPDLTTNDKTHQQNSGILTVDNLMTFDGCTLYAIAESPLERGLIWTGSNDGVVSITRDGGKNWTNVTANMKGLPPWGTIDNIEPSRFDAGTAYVSIDLHQMGNFDPYIYKTSDYGRTWALISSGIPKSVSSYVNVVREDPKKKGMLWAGTDNAVYLSRNDGATWEPLQLNLPPAPVYWVAIQEQFDDLVVGTYGRGFWILDDLGPIRGMTDTIKASDVHLFPVRQAYRFRNVAGYRSAASHVDGENAPYGADITYQLKAPADRIEIAIQDGSGKTIRTMTGTGKAGLNRVWWNLRHDAARQVRLRTSPVGSPWMAPEADGVRPLVVWGAGQVEPMAVPGNYTVKLTAAGKTLTQPLAVVKDPGSAGTEADMQAQLAMMLQIRDEVSEIADMINHLEWTRKEIADLRARIDSDPLRGGAARGKAVQPETASALTALEKKAIAIQNTLEDITLTGRTEDSFRAPMGLYGKYMNLAGEVGGGDMKPTDSARAVLKVLEQQLAQVRSEFNALRETSTPTLNER